jgi:hypothetical protein
MMRYRGTFASIACVLAVGLIAVGGATLKDHGKAGVSSGASSDPVTIDQERRETFTPVAMSGLPSAPSLTSDAAFTVYAKLNGSDARSPLVPATVQLGYLNIPTPPGMETLAPVGTKVTFDAVDNELVWAFEMKNCAPVTSPTESASPPCNEWLFLDASDGHAVDDIYEP